MAGICRVCVGLTTTRDVWGIFDCADKFEMLRWLLAAGTEARIQAGTPVVPPAGFLRLRMFNSSGFQLLRRCIQKYLYANCLPDEFLQVPQLRKFGLNIRETPFKHDAYIL